MSKLLTENELRERVDYLMDTGYAVDIIDLINEQKLAHGEMVIGSDEPQADNGLLPDRVDRRNQLRSEQRERNKV